VPRSGDEAHDSCGPQHRRRWDLGRRGGEEAGTHNRRDRALEGAVLRRRRERAPGAPEGRGSSQGRADRAPQEEGRILLPW